MWKKISQYGQTDFSQEWKVALTLKQQPTPKETPHIIIINNINHKIISIGRKTLDKI